MKFTRGKRVAPKDLPKDLADATELGSVGFARAAGAIELGSVGLARATWATGLVEWKLISVFPDKGVARRCFVSGKAWHQEWFSNCPEKSLAVASVCGSMLHEHARS